MNTKQYLMQLRRTSKGIDEKLAHMGKLSRRVEKRGDREAQRRLHDMQAEVGREVTRMRSQQKAMSTLIAQLPDDKMRGVLTLRYVCGMGWEQAARQMHYSTRHLHRIHQQALQLLEERIAGAPLN